MTLSAPACYSLVMSPRRDRVLFGGLNVATGVLVVFGVFVALTTRWWPVDTAAGLLALLQLLSGVGLLASTAWGPKIARVASAVALALGLIAVTVLAVTASWLGGVYGPVGKGGAIVLVLVAALALPYLVVLPLAQLVWLR